MAAIDTVQLSGENFLNIGRKNIEGLIVANTDTSDLTFDLVLGVDTLEGGTSTTGAVYIIKEILVPVGGSLVWDDDNVLSDLFKGTSTISGYDYNTNSFEVISDLTFLIKLNDSGSTASVVLRRN
tara:strand:+ start:466 stop:840 length:375 start_codon:yes stop_codon:yes gene_type:complete